MIADSGGAFLSRAGAAPQAVASRPELSIVVPVLNEEAAIGAFIERMRAELSTTAASWEIVVVDDGSSDGTAAIVAAAQAIDPRIRLLTGPHRGKGAAVRRGMLASAGEWRFMADADLAMPPDNLSRFLQAARAADAPQVVIGSREAPGAERIGEPWPRHAIGRIFNWIVRLLVLPRIQDTQCGYKLFSAGAAEAIFPRLHTTGFAFDVELLLLARRGGLAIEEVGITWRGRSDTRVALGRGAAAFADLVRIRWHARNRWAARAYAATLFVAAGIGLGLWRTPIQVSDSLGEILDAQRSPSVARSFLGSVHGAGYLRPMRIAQIKAVFDLSGGKYHLAYRGLHVALLTVLLLLFTRLLRVATGRDFAVALFALTVLVGLHTFAAFVREAFPINHFLEIAVVCLAALNLAQSDRDAGGRVWREAGVCLLFVFAALTLESGLLVWVVVVAAWTVGFRGVSTRGVACLTSLLAGYFVLRFGYLDIGTPSLLERSSGFLLEKVEASELQRRFGDGPLLFYAYNVATSFASILAAEPREGVFVAVREWLNGELLPRTSLAVSTSIATTFLTCGWAVARWRQGGGLRRADRLALVAAAVIGANCMLSFAYTKDDIVAVGGVFYALAVFAAGAAVVDRVSRFTQPAAVIAGSLLIAILSTGWAARSLAVDHRLRRQAFRVRNDWADVPLRMAREHQWPSDPAAAALIDALRGEALDAPVPNSQLLPGWHNRWFGD